MCIHYHSVFNYIYLSCVCVCVWGGEVHVCHRAYMEVRDNLKECGALIIWAQDQFQVIWLGSIILPAFGYFLRELSCNIAGLELVGSICPPASASWVAELQMHLLHPALVVFLLQFKPISAWIS